MNKYLPTLLIFVPISLFAQNPILDSLQKQLLKAKSDTSVISLYIQMSANAEDSTALDYCNKAQQMISKLLPQSEGKLKTALLNYLSDAEYYKGYYLYGAEQFDSSLQYYQKALEIATKTGNKKQQAFCLNDIGTWYYSKNDLKTALEYLQKSLAIREALKDENDLQESYNNVAFMLKLTGNIERALDMHFKALALQEKLHQPEDMATSYNNIGNIYQYYLKEYSKAFGYYNKSLALRKAGDKKNIAIMLNNIGSVVSDMGNYRKAIDYYHQSLQLHKSVNSNYGIVESLSNIGYNYRRLHLYDSALVFLYAAIKANEIAQNNDIVEAVYNNLAEVHQAKNNIDSALFYALKENKINVSSGIPYDISKSAELLSMLYEKKGEYKQALKYHQQYAAMEDSIRNDDTKKAGIKSELQYQYLKEKAATDKKYDEQIAKKNLYTWLLVILFVAVCIISFVLYKRYKLKQQLKEVEIRNKIASDLHDDVGSTLSSIRMYSDIVKNQPNQTETSTQLLNKISDNSKEMIENMSDIVWMIKPGNDEFSNIENRMLNFANELCVPAGINFEFVKNAEADDIKIPMEMRRDIYLIFKEAINNAVKYSNCHFINAEISLKNHQLQMRISDDGNGFDKSTIKKGNGLFNMQKRTTVHNGTFHINSTHNEGTEITVTFNT